MILLNDILNINSEEMNDFLIALNNPLKHENPLNFYLYSINDFYRFIGWFRSFGKRNAFRVLDKKYSLQFIQLNQSDKWLFVGCFYNESNQMNSNEYGEYYSLKLSDRYANFEGRLVAKFKKDPGPKQAKLNISRIKDFEVYQILVEKYTGEKFKGYKNIDLDFESMKCIINSGKEDWYNNLSTVKGIYLITDNNNKLYVGSAYGVEGIWGRWKEYVNTNGHGNNIALIPPVSI
jgi:hypothetical protein